jgi:broad specificity phosphatase PhoE
MVGGGEEDRLSSRESALSGSQRPLLSVVVAGAGARPGRTRKLAAALDPVPVTALLAAPGAEDEAGALAELLARHPSVRELPPGGADALLERELKAGEGAHHAVLVVGSELAQDLLAAALGDLGTGPGPSAGPGGLSILSRRPSGELEAICVNVDLLDPLRATTGRGPRPRRLYLIRHGECAIPTPDGRLHSHCDFPLTARGKKQVEDLAVEFARLEDVAFLASPIERARESAAAIAAGRPVEVVAGLAEISLGEFEGAAIDDVYAAQPRFLLDGDAGLPGGETPDEVAARASAALARALESHPEPALVAVAHGGTNRAAIGRLLGAPPVSALRLRQDWAAVNLFEETPRGWRLALLNWTPAGLAELPYADASWHGETVADLEADPGRAGAQTD